jgi:Icc-related predicted phosphoesterase
VSRNSGHLRTLLAVGPLNGELDTLAAVLSERGAAAADAVVVAGDLAAPWDVDPYPAIFRALGTIGKPTFWIPGPNDAPLRRYLPEAANLEVAFPSLRSIHGTLAFGPASVIFAGIGGEIVDDPDAVRDEHAVLRYPGWDAEYRLKALREFPDHQKVLAFTTPPEHKGLGWQGSAVVAELINTHNPRAVVAASGAVAEERLGNTLVVSPGRLDRGQYAVVDVRDRFAAVATLVSRGVRAHAKGGIA